MARHQNKLQSIADMATLQGIGHVVTTMEPFDRSVTEALRVDLGDWRDLIDWSLFDVSDAIERSSLYIEHGLNQGLARIPYTAFEQGIAAANLSNLQAQ